MKLPVVLLNAGGDAAARARTIDSLASQSVDVCVHASLPDATVDGNGYVVFVLAGAVLDATACERAVWFLATHAAAVAVTGATASQTHSVRALSGATQFLAIRTTVAQRLLTADDTLHAATAIALAIGVRRETGRGVAWMLEPVLREPASDAVLDAITADVRAALPQLGFDEVSLVDLSTGGVPLAPQQRLMCVSRPTLRVRVSPARGLRVLALLQGFPMGGYTAFNADLLPRLAAAGHAITTCTTEWWRTDWRLDHVRAAAPDIHHAHAVVPPAAVPAYVDWLITSRRIDVVLTSHSQIGFHLLPYLRARHPKVAFVDYVHTDWFEAGMYGSYAAMATRWEGQLDAQLATSDALVTALIASGCEPDALHAAHIGIDTTIWQHNGPRLADVRTSLGATASTILLLFAGRVSPEKRPHLAVDVAAQLVAEGHDAVLVVAGGGTLLQATHERATQRGIADRVKMLGELDEHTLRHVYAACDVFIAPSEIEGIARSLYEAMAMGCVPVVSDVGGQRELVLPGTGSLVDASGDGASLYVEGVRPWLDADSRRQASAAARAHIVDNFDSARTVTIVSDTMRRARERRRLRQSVLPTAMAEEFAVMSLELTRRHVLQAMAR